MATAGGSDYPIMVYPEHYFKFVTCVELGEPPAGRSSFAAWHGRVSLQRHGALDVTQVN